jgi:hypothetical protein
MERIRSAAGGLGVAALLLTGASGVCAQDWPTRPIKIVSPLASGGAADVIGHAVGEAFSVATKLPVIVDHRPGGGGTLAAVTVARADPDGTTLLLGSAAALNVAPVLAKNFPSDLVANLTPLTLAVELPMCWRCGRETQGDVNLRLGGVCNSFVLLAQLSNPIFARLCGRCDHAARDAPALGEADNRRRWDRRPPVRQ